MRWIALALLLAPACKKAPEPAPSATPASWLQIRKRLAVRDPAPTCAQAAADRTDPLPAFVHWAETDAPPAWVPLRAAACVLEVGPDREADRIAGWAVDPDRRGLALVVFQSLDTLPEALAVRVATDGLAGPHADDARAHLADTSSPALADLRATLEAP